MCTVDARGHGRLLSTPARACVSATVQRCVDGGLQRSATERWRPTKSSSSHAQSVARVLHWRPRATLSWPNRGEHRGRMRQWAEARREHPTSTCSFWNLTSYNRRGFQPPQANGGTKPWLPASGSLWDPAPARGAVRAPLAGLGPIGLSRPSPREWWMLAEKSTPEQNTGARPSTCTSPILRYSDTPISAYRPQGRV